MVVKDETKILLLLAAMLLVLESGARVFETRLSKDVQHLREIPRQAALLQTAPKEALKVLVLGNSLARCGIDLPLLSEGLKQQFKREIVIAVMYPDGSSIEEWTYGYRRYFMQTGASPDVILVTTGKLHLTDHPPSINAMGAFYVSGADLGEFARSHLSGVEDAVRFGGARLSALWAHRDRVEPLVFYNLVPGYTETAQELNQGALSTQHAPSMSAPSPTCHTFEYFLKGLKTTGTRLLLISVPMPEPYNLPDTVRKAVQGAGVTLLDFGATLKMPTDRFPDHYHLDAQGATELTRRILNHWPPAS